MPFPGILSAVPQSRFQQITPLIRLIALEDQTPIEGVICWKRDWGTADKMPGIGIRFDALTEGQESEILCLIETHRGQSTTHRTI